jgi:hypothetical protein
MDFRFDTKSETGLLQTVNNKKHSHVLQEEGTGSYHLCRVVSDTDGTRDASRIIGGTGTI